MYLRILILSFYKLNNVISTHIKQTVYITQFQVILLYGLLIWEDVIIRSLSKY